MGGGGGGGGGAQRKKKDKQKKNDEIRVCGVFKQRHDDKIKYSDAIIITDVQIRALDR